eukprot:9270647-Ditylum_brightwellii.AAC.1
MKALEFSTNLVEIQYVKSYEMPTNQLRVDAMTMDAITDATEHMEESQGCTVPDPDEDGEWKEQGRKDKRKKRDIQIDAKVRKSETNEQQESST